MMRVGKRWWSTLLGKECIHSEARGRVVPHGLWTLDQSSLAVDVQHRDLDRGAGDLLVDQVLVQKIVHSTVHLLQVHLFVLRNGGRGGGGVRKKGKEGHRNLNW